MDDFDFDKMWEEVVQTNEASSLNLTEQQSTETTNEYKIIDAIAYYAHVCKLLELLYHAKLGRPYDQKIEIQNSEEEEDYDYQFTEFNK